jgi:hypothetical protein
MDSRHLSHVIDPSNKMCQVQYLQPSSYTDNYALGPTVVASTSQAPPSSSVTPRAYRALLIPEILELILRHAAPRTQYAARNVNTTWRSTAQYVLSSQHRSHHPCSPVEHGQLIDTSLSWLQPSDDKIADAEREAVTLSHKALTELETPFWPARITQAHALSEPAYLAIQSLYHRFHWRPPVSHPQNEDPRWLDLSQLRLNPYLLELFSERLETNVGWCEITLKPGPSQHRVIKKPLPDDAFAQLIGPMFITEPPCKSLGIYASQLGTSNLHLLARVCNEDGIRIHQFLSALEEHAKDLLHVWMGQANFLHKRIREPHWTTFTTILEKHLPWIYAGSPKFMVYLEEMNVGSEILAKQFYRMARNFDSKCESERYRDVATDQTPRSGD